MGCKSVDKPRSEFFVVVGSGEERTCEGVSDTIDGTEPNGGLGVELASGSNCAGVAVLERRTGGVTEGGFLGEDGVFPAPEQLVPKIKQPKSATCHKLLSGLAKLKVGCPTAIWSHHEKPRPGNRLMEKTRAG